MSIKAYVGRMGAGKSYEVVTSVIVPALGRGRRVVSNIAGLDYDAICAHLRSQGVQDIGALEQVSHDAVSDPWFWLTDGSDDSDKLSPDRVPFVQPGDLLVLDEIWRFWNGFGSRKMPGRVMNFMRMHRHFAHEESGLTCDVVLITQDVDDIGRIIRAVIEETYRMVKLTTLGLQKGYRVEVYSGVKRFYDPPIRTLIRKYNPAFFGFYRSHSQKSEEGAEAVEENVDNRGNILKGAFFKFFVPLAAIFLCISAYSLYGFFHPKSNSKDSHKTESVAAAAEAPPSSSPSPASSAPSQVFPEDEISRLLTTSQVSLHYFRRSDTMQGSSYRAVIRFSGDAGIREFSDAALYLMGWRLFYSYAGRQVILTNGKIVRVIEYQAEPSALSLL
jgi:zona occludens toxin